MCFAPASLHAPEGGMEYVRVDLVTVVQDVLLQGRRWRRGIPPRRRRRPSSCRGASAILRGGRRAHARAAPATVAGGRNGNGKKVLSRCGAVAAAKGGGGRDQARESCDHLLDCGRPTVEARSEGPRDDRLMGGERRGGGGDSITPMLAQSPACPWDSMGLAMVHSCRCRA